MEKILDDVETRVRAAKLFDQYGALLKDNARGIFEEYFSDDLSLSEVASHAGITRQGVHDSIKRSLGQLEEYESRLQLVSRREEAEILISELEKISLKSNDKALKKIAVKLESLV